MLKLTFLDFGLFLKNIDVSDKFISGNGDIIFKLDNQSNTIISGKYLIKDFNIKDASFLARLLQLASFTGLLEILASEGIPFTNLEGAFKLAILTLMNTVNSNIHELNDFNFNELQYFTKYFLVIFMIIGRVELLTLLIILKKFLFKN